MGDRRFKEEMWRYYAFREFIEKPLQKRGKRKPDRCPRCGGRVLQDEEGRIECLECGWSAGEG